jgi:hypothetical protein
MISVHIQFSDRLSEQGRPGGIPTGEVMTLFTRLMEMRNLPDVGDVVVLDFEQSQTARVRLEVSKRIFMRVDGDYVVLKCNRVTKDGFRENSPVMVTPHTRMVNETKGWLFERIQREGE